MFLLSNVAGVFGTFAYSEKLKDTTNNVWLLVYSLILAINQGLANIADWEFSFEYYNMVRIIPFVLDEIPPPLIIVKSNIAQFWILTILNTIAAVLLGVSSFFKNINDQVIIIYVLTLFSFISAIYLVWSVYRIRKLTKEKKLDINTKIIIVHALTVSIYLLSLFAFAWPWQHNLIVQYAARFLEAFCNRLTQVMICYIFWNMDNIKFVPVPTAQQTADEEVAPEDAIEEVRVERTD